MNEAKRQRPQDDIVYPSCLLFVLVHLLCFAVIWTGLPVRAAVLGVILYFLRIFGIGAGYHRYFSHRSYRTSRAFQLCLAFLSQTAAQGGVLWWAANHRLHHKYSDTDQDVHSPARHGFFYAHLGWIFMLRNDATRYDVVRDLIGYKELLWLDRYKYLPAASLAAVCWLIAGPPGLVAFCISTVAVWHATFCTNSVAHLLGHRRYVTADDSSNNWFLALLTMGEGWHNNHHAYQVSVRQGFRWWEYDPTFYLLRALSWLGIVWDLHTPPTALVRGEQRLGQAVIDKLAGQLAGLFPINQIANQVLESLSRSPRWAELKARFLSARQQAESFWSEIDLPQVPSLEEVRRLARARLVHTPALEEIAVTARQHLLDLIYSRLVEVAPRISAG